MALIEAMPYPKIPWRSGVTAQPPEQIEQLIKRAKAGDDKAISHLYEQHVNQIYRYIAYRVPEAEAEDITADVFIGMVKGLAHYTYTGAPFEAWLYKIASARIADFYRKQGRTESVELSEQIKTDIPQPEESLINEQEQDNLRAKLAVLSDEQRLILLLRFVERKSHEDVAQILNKSVTAVKTMQHRALKRLAQLMGQSDKERHYLRGHDD